MLDELGNPTNLPLAMMLQMVITVVAGISAQVLGDYLKVPSIVFLLCFGIALGADGLDWLHPQLLGNGLEVIVALSVALILFEGGLNLELRRLNYVSGSLRNLVTLGTLITLLGGGMAAHWLGEFPWAIAFLYASLVVVTGPTVVGPLLKQVQVDRQVATLLEGEGVLIDPVGAILAVVVLDVILNGDTDPLIVMSGLLLRLGIGGLIGAAGGGLLGFFLKRSRFLSDDLKNLVVLAGIWGLFGLAQAIRSESGLMTAVVAGLVLRASSIPDERLLRRFKGQLTILAVSVLFVLLAADLSIASLFALGQGAIFTVGVLMLVVRPINVWICTHNSTLNWRQKLFVSWVAPKGIVSASVASLFAILLTDRGITGGDAIKALVFLTIISTVFLQGLTAGWMAQLLGITSKQSTGAVIVGCNPLSRLIGRLFQDKNESVVLIDTDADACREAEAEGLFVIASSALDTEALERAGLEKAGTFLAITTNADVNLVTAQRAAEEFSPPRVLAVIAGDRPPESLPNSPKVQHAFLPQVSLKTWNRYLTDREVKLGETTLREADLERQQTYLQSLINDEKLLPLLIDRNDQLKVVSARDALEAGDRLLFLWHAPKPKLLKRLGGSNPQTTLTIEHLPEVDDIPEPSPEPPVTPPPPPPSTTPPIEPAPQPETTLPDSETQP